MKTFVVVPAYNEAKHIEDTLKAIKKHTKNIIIVDDGSKDATKKIASKHGLVLSHIINLGKGAALRTGCDYAIQQGATHIIVIDSDGQHDPQKIPEFLTALKKHDIIYGYRHFSKDMPFVLRLGNKALSLAIRILFGVKVQDTQCGFRAFTKKAYEKIAWESTGYAMESEMIARAAKHNIAFAELLIPTIYNDNYKGTSAFDGIKIMLTLIYLKITLTLSR